MDINNIRNFDKLLKMVDWKKVYIFFASLGTIGGIIGFSVLTYLGNIHAGKFLVYMRAYPCYAFFR